MKYVLLAGRVFFSMLFIFSSTGHFSAATIGYAASAGIPAANIMVPLSGIVELLGGLSILLGYKAKWGAWLLVLFLVPVTLTLHAFWKIPDGMQRQMDMANFMKNLSLLGTSFMIAYWGSGPLSLDKKSDKQS